MTTANTRFLMERVKKELKRLDSLDEGKDGITVTAPDFYPDGWLKIADEGGMICGPASELLARLELRRWTTSMIQARAAITSAPHHYGVVFDLDHEPGANAWRDFHEFVQGIRIGSMGLLVFRTNAGLRWGFAPINHEHSTHDYSPLFHSAEVAMDAAAEFDARIMAETRLSDEWPYKGNQHDTDLSRGDSCQGGR